MYKIIIAGGRDFNDYPLLKKVLDELFGDPDVVASLQSHGGLEIVSGKQVTKPDWRDESTWHGGDYLGEKYAKENCIPVMPFAADWGTHGQKAGFLRNREMADYADSLIAFWDKRSKGTKSMIDLMEERHKPYNVINY